MIPRPGPSAAHRLTGFRRAECDDCHIDNGRQHWNARYSEHGHASPGAPEVISLDADLGALVPTSGRALDIACGRGAQAAWLAMQGLDVVALDVSDAAIALTRATASSAGVSSQIDARRVDLTDGLSNELGQFDFILCQRFRNHAVLATIAERLGPEGVAFVTVLSAVGLERSPGRFHAPDGELIGIFNRADVEISWHHEGDGLASIVLRRI